MEIKPVLRLSVRAVVETTLYEPDLVPAMGVLERMHEGTRAHLARQQSGREQETAYESEVPLEAQFETESLILRVTGRADGIYEEQGHAVIEEIKLGNPENDLNPAHMAQAEMYGHMLCESKQLDGVHLVVRYVDTKGAVLAQYREELSSDELRVRFEELCLPAALRAARAFKRETARNRSIETLRFPYPSYRSGQKTFSTAVYAAIRDRRRLFAQAPTGIGKTMASLYPAVHALRQGKCAGILFLTARGTGRRAALEAAGLLTRTGAQLYVVEIMAKAKVCPFEEQKCHPEFCPRAKGFYTRLETALEVAGAGSVWDACAIGELAERYCLCPFELSLEMAKQADLVVCDYNYAYDPVVAIEALLGRRGGVSILVDEAHRLCERVMDDYSVTVRMQSVRELRRDTGKQLGRKHAVYQALTAVIRSMERIETQETETDSPWGSMDEEMQHLLEAAGEANRQESAACLLDAMSLSMDWLCTSQRFSERYAFLTDGRGDRFEMGIYLMDAAPEILAVSKRARGVVYFSATLSPLPATMRLLGSLPDDLTMMLPSPFSPEALTVTVLPLDVRYQARERNADRLSDALTAFLLEHVGNSMVFFPSYAFMEQITGRFPDGNRIGNKQLLFEKKGMEETERASVIERFLTDSDQEVALFCVLGGSFAEGIDLPGDCLRNVAVVSTGLPVMDTRIRAMQQYYQARDEDGFFYTMTLPGMIRVIQAAGRLIRTETDTGSLLLIDSRYTQRQIRTLLEGTLIGEALSAGRA